MPMTRRSYLGAPLLICSWALCLSLGGCHHRTEQSASSAERTDSTADFDGLYKGLNGGPIGGTREVLRDSTRWRAVWKASCCSRKPATPIPEMDFARYIVVFAADPRGVLGDSVIIDQANESQGSLRVQVISYKNCLPGQISTCPAHLIRIPRSGREVVFENNVIRGPNCI